MTGLSKRPATIAEVASRTLAGQQEFDPALREFLDEFYSHPSLRQGALQQEPVLIEDVKDAYLAASTEHLASIYGLEVPAWADQHGRPLKRPFFAGGLESLKAILTVESPAAFRRRLLFVGKDALDRPRRRSAAPDTCGHDASGNDQANGPAPPTGG